MRRFLGPMAMLLPCVLCAVLCTTLAGCSGKKDEELIRSTVTAFLDEYRQPTAEEARELVDAETRKAYDEIALYDVDVYSVVMRYFSRFDYTIDEVSVNGTQASAALTVRNVDVASVLATVTQRYTSEKGAKVLEELYNEGGDNAMYQRFFDDLAQELDTAEVVETQTAITLTKANDAWTVDASCIPNVVGAIYGDAGATSLM